MDGLVERPVRLESLVAGRIPDGGDDGPFYMWRLVFLTFWGRSRVDHEVEGHIHESPRVMLVPLGVLAVLSVVGGWISWPTSLGGSNRLEHWLAPVFQNQAAVAAVGAPEAHHDPFEYVLMLLAIGLAGAGVYVAYQLYHRRPERADQLQGQFRPGLQRAAE